VIDLTIDIHQNTKKDLLEEQNKLASSGIINSAKSGDIK
jgi:hypothetical protein